MPVKEIKHLDAKWKTLCFVLSPFFKQIFRFKPEICQQEGPCLVVANHVTNFDPILVGISFPKKPLCLVASEHLFRKGWMTKAILMVVCMPLGLLFARVLTDRRWRYDN